MATKEVAGCKVIDEVKYFIEDGYVLMIENERYVVKHEITEPFEDFIRVNEKITVSFPALKKEGGKKVSAFDNAEQVVQYAKERLERRCKHYKKLFVDEGVLEYLENFKDEDL